MPRHRGDPDPDKHGKKHGDSSDEPRITGRAGRAPGRQQGSNPGQKGAGTRPERGFGATGGKAGRHGPGAPGKNG